MEAGPHGEHCYLNLKYGPSNIQSAKSREERTISKARRALGASELDLLFTQLRPLLLFLSFAHSLNFVQFCISSKHCDETITFVLVVLFAFKKNDTRNCFSQFTRFNKHYKRESIIIFNFLYLWFCSRSFSRILRCRSLVRSSIKGSRLALLREH